jgi:hypothetical protein
MHHHESEYNVQKIQREDLFGRISAVSVRS